MSDMLGRIGRIVAGAYYDHQQVRIGSMNRMRDIVWRKNEGIPFDKKIEKEEKKNYDKRYSDKEISNLLKEMRKENKLTDNELEYMLNIVDIAIKESGTEKSYKIQMMKYINQEIIYTKFLNRIKGLGPVLSANMLKWFGYCEKYKMVSSLWKHCGLHVIETDGQEHAPKRKRGEKIDWNPQLRTLCWKISDSFIKQRTPYYRDIYDKIKARELNRKDDNKPKSKLHADLRARRYTVKRFLQHYWDCAKELTGQERTKPYIMGKGKHTHYETWKEAVKINEEERMK